MECLTFVIFPIGMSMRRYQDKKIKGIVKLKVTSQQKDSGIFFEIIDSERTTGNVIMLR